jgi:hypothetical protein
LKNTEIIWLKSLKWAVSLYGKNDVIKKICENWHYYGIWKWWACDYERSSADFFISYM